MTEFYFITDFIILTSGIVWKKIEYICKDRLID